jgi:hypothetical protein
MMTNEKHGDGEVADGDGMERPVCLGDPRALGFVTLY